MIPVEMEEVLHKGLQIPVQRLLAEVPVQRRVFIPLVELREILSHKEELLPGMSEHKEIGRLEISELVLCASRHLVDHGAFQMYDLIVGEDEDELLARGIAHAEGHFIVVELPEIGVQLHIVQEIVHPAHVPLKVKAEAVVLRPGRHLRPGCGFLRDDDAPVAAAADHGVQVLEKFYRIEISVSAEAIRDPLSVSSAVIQIEHGGDRVHTEAVDMVLFIPVERISDQKVLHLVLGIVENFCPPVRVLPHPGIRIFIAGRAVEVRKSVRVLWEMGGHPVENDTDIFLMEVVHKIHEVLRTSVAGGRREITCDLVAPGGIQGMLRDAHELNMRITHVQAVLRDLHRALPVIHKAGLAPRILLPGA